MIIKEINYKEKYPKAYNLGYLKGEKSYNSGYSRENVVSYAERYANKSFIDEYEGYAFQYGIIDGWGDSEKENYKVNLNEDYES